MATLMRLLVLLGLLTGALTSLSACENTLEGMGQDIDELEEGDPGT